MGRPTDFHESLRGILTFSARDWAEGRDVAWIYGIVCGWDPDPADPPDEDSDEAMADVARQHGWDDAEVERLRHLHRQFVDSARAAEGEQHVEWHVEYATPGRDDWEPHVRCTGQEAAKVVLEELRAAHPAHSWRAARHHASTVAEEW